MGRLLGVDPGLRRVGLALTDSDQVLTRPFRVVDRETESLSEVLESLLEKYEIERIVVGYPDPLKVSENERTRQVDRFLREFIQPLPVPHTTVSERYTTKLAGQLRERRGESGPPGDDEAAALILEHYLEHGSSRSPEDPQSP